MTKFSATAIAAVLFCLFTLSVSRIQPETDDTSTSVSLPISDVTLPAEHTVNTETESNSAAVTSVPLTKLTFRPINRHFISRRNHPCSHHDPTKREHVEIPYSNDMIVASGENSDFHHPEMIQGGRRRWVRMHRHHHHHDEDSDSDDEDDDKIKRIALKHHAKFDREKNSKAWKKMKKHFRHQREEEEKNGFFNRVRKFMHNYF